MLTRASHVVAAALLWSASPSQALRLDIGLNFTGATFLEVLPLNPPDTVGGVGEEHVVQRINGGYRVYDKGDGSLLESKGSGRFWIDAGVTPQGSGILPNFDPRVLYDPDSQRWFTVEVDARDSADSAFLVGVSKSADPTDGWTGFRIDADSTDEGWADFPRLGVNADGVYLAANMFPNPDFGFNEVTETFVVLPKEDLLAPTPTVANATLFTGLDSFSSQPVFDLDGAGVPASFLSAGPTASVVRTNVTGDIVAPMIEEPEQIRVTPFPFTGGAEQPGDKFNLEVVGGFTSRPVLQNGAFWGVEAVFVNNSHALRWVQIDAATNIVLQEGIIADDELHLYYPSVAVNEFDEVVIGFNGSGESQFVSAYAVFGDTVGGVTTFDDPLLLKEGLADYERLSGGRNRWGDYSATVVDPSDPRIFWTLQEFVSFTDVWSTQITQLVLIPEPSTGLLVACGLTVLALRRLRRPEDPLV